MPLGLVTWGALAAPGLADEGEEAGSLAEVRVEAQALGKGDRYLPTAVLSLKGSADLLNVPQAVSVVTRQLIDDQAMRSLSDAVRYVPGIGVAQGEGNRETLVFRGSSSTADYLVDGLRDDVQYYRDLYNVAQIEALKGPNGLAFGRGGVGGVINRVTKQAGLDVAALSLQAGSWDGYRAALDVGGRQEADRPAWRLNGVWEDAGSYRDGVTLHRHGLAPAAALELGQDSRLTLQGEYFHDERVADRGVSSFNGRPLDTGPGEFFGDASRSPTGTTLRSAGFGIEHSFSDSVALRNRTRYASYDKYYQNVFPGAVAADGTQVAISAYGQRTARRNLFNQTDLSMSLSGFGLRHEISTGVELGRQDTDNQRVTGYFTDISPTTTSILVPVDAPTTTAAIQFRASATDANNAGRATTLAAYLQHRVLWGEHWETVLGYRRESFGMDYTDRRVGGGRIETQDALESPGLSVVYKPTPTFSTYLTYGGSRQPRAGEQLASLTVANAALSPESFRNQEIGAKWDLQPGLQATLAAYRLERRNVAITDPTNSAQLLLVDGQRVEGAEFGLSGRLNVRWQVMAAAAWQDGRLLSDQSVLLRKDARLAALPEWTASLWNRFQLDPRWGVGLGLSWRDEMFAAVENLATPSSNVVLPGYARVDTALFYNSARGIRAQLNVDNLLDRRYFVSAHSNTNITPGPPRSLRLSVSLAF
jgi:catecholate siderophore receptor